MKINMSDWICHFLYLGSATLVSLKIHITAVPLMLDIRKLQQPSTVRFDGYGTGGTMWQGYIQCLRILLFPVCTVHRSKNDNINWRPWPWLLLATFFHKSGATLWPYKAALNSE
ncbi:hypothetical protein ACMFMG_004508 [Clarireedia jacksonii]